MEGVRGGIEVKTTKMCVKLSENKKGKGSYRVGRSSKSGDTVSVASYRPFRGSWKETILS